MSVAISWSQLTVTGAVAIHETQGFSGGRKLACFCPKCGTRMWHRSAKDSEWITLKVGTLEDAADIAPRGHLWVAKKQPWIELDPSLPAFDTQPEDVHIWRSTLI